MQLRVDYLTATKRTLIWAMRPMVSAQQQLKAAVEASNRDFEETGEAAFGQKNRLYSD